MITDLNHIIDNDPEPKDAGTIIVTATIFDDDDNFDLPFTTTSLPIKDFFGDENDDFECLTIQELRSFLVEADIDDDVIDDAMVNLVAYVDGLTCSTSSSEYSPGCALAVQLEFSPAYLVDDDDDEEESLQGSFDETSNNTRSRPASKLVVKSLPRRIYDKKIKKKKRNQKKISLEECTICLEEFSNGAELMTLPCGHDFDDECIVKWFETSHVCPLCRFELPREDQLNQCSIGCTISTTL